LNASRGLFITLEGGEGAGKTTNLNVIVEELAAEGVPHKVTREPGGTELGEKLRELLLGAQTRLTDDTELLLMFAARAEHLQTVILPALSRGEWVICDRFTDSTYAYQGWGRGISLERISALEEWVQGGTRPDRTFLFDLPVEIGMQRARDRAVLDRFEKENIDFMGRVRSGFLNLAECEPERIKVIRADRNPEQVAQEVRASVNELVEHWRGRDSA